MSLRLRITKHLHLLANYFPPRPLLLVERLGVVLRLRLPEERLGDALRVERLGLALRVRLGAVERVRLGTALRVRLGAVERVRLGVALRVLRVAEGRTVVRLRSMRLGVARRVDDVERVVWLRPVERVVVGRVERVVREVALPRVAERPEADVGVEREVRLIRFAMEVVVPRGRAEALRLLTFVTLLVTL